MGNSSSVSEIKQDDFKDIALRAHNKFRKLHGSPPLKYSKDLSLYAQNHALFLTTKPHIFRSARYCQGDFIGENIGVKVLPSSVTEYGAEEVTQDWYNEIEQYSFYDNDPPDDIKLKCRNFTQLVWKSSTEVGFGTASKGRRAIVVACYKPTGNKREQFAKNVMPQLYLPLTDRACAKCLKPGTEE